MGQGHHRHGHKGGGRNRGGSERGKESRHQWRWSGGLNARRDITDRTTGEARGAPPIAACKAAQAKAKAKTRTGTDTDSENHIDGDGGDDISTDTGQTVRDSPTTKAEEIGQPSPSPDDRLELSRQTYNPKERQECTTPQ